MLKNKMTLITILLILILAVTIPVVRAENEVTTTTTNEEQQVMPISEGDQASSGQTPVTTDANFKKGDVYLSGDNVTVDYIVDGNLFVIAKQVTINSQIGGDAFILADTVIVGEQGYVFSNLFTTASNVNVKGVVYDVYAFANKTDISGYVYRDLHVGGNELNISGVVRRNAFATVANLTFNTVTTEGNTSSMATTPTIAGNLEYNSKSEATIPEGTIKGETKHTTIANNNNNLVQKYLLSLGSLVATVALIWFVSLKLAPKFSENTNNLMAKKILPVIGFGLLTPIALVLLSLIFIVLGITSSFGLLVLSSLFILIAISTSIFVIGINNLICKKLKIEKNVTIFGMLVLATIILWAIGLIPYVGSIVTFIAVVIGLGLITTHLLNLKKKEKVVEIKAEKVKTEKDSK